MWYVLFIVWLNYTSITCGRVPVICLHLCTGVHFIDKYRSDSKKDEMHVEQSNIEQCLVNILTEQSAKNGCPHCVWYRTVIPVSIFLKVDMFTLWVFLITCYTPITIVIVVFYYVIIIQVYVNQQRSWIRHKRFLTFSGNVLKPFIL